MPFQVSFLFNFLGAGVTGPMGVPSVPNMNAANIVPLPNIPHLSQQNDDGSLKPQSNFSANDPAMKWTNDNSKKETN